MERFQKEWRCPTDHVFRDMRPVYELDFGGEMTPERLVPILGNLPRKESVAFQSWFDERLGLSGS